MPDRQLHELPQTFEPSRWYAFLIVAIVALAHSPAVFNDYLRQDDWNFMFWNRSYPTSQLGYYNAMFERFWPLSRMISIVSDYIDYNMQYAWIVRSANIAFLCVAAVLLFRWQLKCGFGRTFAFCFAISALVLPGVQVVASTGNYTFLAITIVLAECACFLFLRGYLERVNRVRFYAFGFLLLFASLLCYPLDTTYIFIFLLIYFLQNPGERWWRLKSFVAQAGILSLACMVTDLITAKCVQFAFHVVPKNPERAVVFDWDIPSKFHHWWVMLEHATNFYDFDSLFPGFNANVPIGVYGSYLLARTTAWNVVIFLTIFMSGITLAWKNLGPGASPSYGRFAGKILLAFLIAITLAYAPVLPPRYVTGYAFRYTQVTMPLCLFAVFWSARQFSIYAIARWKGKSQLIFKRLAYTFTLLTAAVCFHHVERYLAGPANFELNFVRGKIAKEALPALEKGKPVTLYFIMGNHVSSLPGDFHSMEYGFGIGHYTTEWLLAAGIYTMREMGYESIERPPGYHAIEFGKERIRMEFPWGYIFVARRDQPRMHVPANSQEVDIDLDQAGRFE